MPSGRQASVLAHVIIGHTTATTATVWVRGGRLRGSATVSLRGQGGEPTIAPVEVPLSRAGDYTGVARFTGLLPDCSYDVRAEFGWGESAEGELRTFPAPESKRPFAFLHGSCNLSTVTLTHTGSLALSAIGMLATLRSVDRFAEPRRRAVLDTLRQALALVMKGIAFAGWWLVYRITGFEQPEPLPPSPFLPLLAELHRENGEAPRFMIHAGDQIYYDFPFPSRQPRLTDYRRAYRQAWFEDEDLQKFLAKAPQYMTIDDHEIVDAFANDALLPKERAPARYAEPALRAYEEYVNARHPSAGKALWYDFACGGARFFALDTRSQRYLGYGEMIDEAQLFELEQWLAAHPNELKFVISSIPFLAGIHDRDESSDKWSGPRFGRQRDRIVEYVCEKGIDRVVFLVGDMHCSYHATMRVGRPQDRVTLHELAGGPVNQLDFASRSDFCPQVRGRTSGLKALPFTTLLRRLHGASSSVLRITALPEEDEVRWEVIRTSRSLRSEQDGHGAAKRPTLAGRITFGPNA